MKPQSHRVTVRRARPCTALVLLVVVGALTPSPAAATCQFDLQQVRSSYELGRQDLVLETILGCLEIDGLAGQELTDAYEYLAKAYLALDEFGQAEETVRLLIQRNPAFSPASGDPPFFRRMVDAAKRGDRTVVISSVSKSNESLREAPATVVVVTAEEIRRRGYLDLEQVLHDLPGFDISRGNGTIYSNFYQRGYRSANNDRTLFLVDGVENNDVWSNVAYLSRQYPLSNIERVEVIYGPASTMYGPNAFVGVINVITRSPQSWLDEDQKATVEARVGGGAWETRWLDATAAGQAANGNVAWSVTGRVYESDEMDLSGFDCRPPTEGLPVMGDGCWDFDPDFYESVDYFGRLDKVGAEATEFLAGLTPAERQILDDSPLVSIGPNDSTVLLTRVGIQEARFRDQQALRLDVLGSPVGFSNRTDDYSLNARARLWNVDLGFQTWRRNEGISGWYVDTDRAGSDNGNLWIPSLTIAWLKYETSYGKIGLRVFSQFLRQEVADGSGVNRLRGYANGRLDILDLASDVPSFWEETRFRESSRQFRAEATLVYTHSPRFNIVSGVEARSSYLQGNYFLSSAPTAPLDQLSDELIAQRTSRDTDGEFFDQLDLGIFAQASFRPSKDWKLVVGGRLDNNTVDPTAGAVVVQEGDGERVFESFGYGTVFNPRLAAVYSPGPFVFKAIYAEAFKDASNLNRYAVSPGVRDLPNPDLAPEEVRNFELSASWQVHDDLHVDLAAYRSEYSDAVAQRRVPFGGGETLQNRSVGTLEISGLQSTLRYTFGRERPDRDGKPYDLWANYTWTEPKSTNPQDASGNPRTDAAGNPLGEVRVGDIADYRLNMGFNAALGRRLDLNLRLNHVGDRETGASTSVSGNPYEVIDAYTVVHAAVSFKELLPGLSLQLVVNNLFDEVYYHPGVRSAAGSFASRLPQNERAVFLRGVYGF